MIPSSPRPQPPRFEPDADPVLPVELWEIIVDFIPQDAALTLRALSLVNRMFRILSQKILFSHVNLGNRRKSRNTDSLIDFHLLLRTPRISHLVTHLELGWGLGIDREQLPITLPCLPRIEHLGLAVPKWKMYSEDIKQALRMHTFPHITSLVLRTMALSASLLAWILQMCPQLKHLSIVGPRTDAASDDTYHLSYHGRPHALEALTIDRWVYNSIAVLLESLKIAECRELQSLVLGDWSSNEALDRGNWAVVLAPLLGYTAQALTTLDLSGCDMKKVPTDQLRGIQPHIPLRFGSQLTMFSQNHMS